MSKFLAIRDMCLGAGVLYEDPDFPALPQSVYFSKLDPRIVWKRPHELALNPVIIEQGISQFDLNQGSIGNCWYIAAAALLATHPDLFSRVVPSGQDFDDDYAGVFHFYFWRFGEWVEVVIDDRLPTRYNKLIFCNNRQQPNEFWSPLLEKAYAKLHGSYEALDGGFTDEALVDFTGGVGDKMDLKDSSKIPRDLYNILEYNQAMTCLMGCSISATKQTMEQVRPNGIVIGHAYSITAVRSLMFRGSEHRLLRLRNPWGQTEWRGPWSDRSRERREAGSQLLVDHNIIDEDGEFWMPFEDWLQNFETLELCYLPNTGARQDSKRIWKEVSHSGSWIRGVSAGGCGNQPYVAQYWMNPQYVLQLKEPNTRSSRVYGKGTTCTVIVSLMQKHRRLMRTTLRRGRGTNMSLGFAIYKLNLGSLASPLHGGNYQRYVTQLAKKTDVYTDYRAITHFYQLPPGDYLVIPSLYQYGSEADFLLRMYTEKKASSREIDTPTGVTNDIPRKPDPLKALFKKHAREDPQIDARELRGLLNEAFSQELGENQEFEMETCRSMIVMMDLDDTGRLEYEEVRRMWAELQVWKTTFAEHDQDRSGYLDVAELKAAFASTGYNLSRQVLRAIVRRYGGKEGRLTFDDFVLIATKIVVVLRMFAHYSPGGLKGRAEFTLDEWMAAVLFC